METDLIHAQDIFLTKINRICSKFGLNNIMAQLYAILYLNSRPLSLDDMAERLTVSKGSASTNIRMLERYGAVRRVWVKGSRKDYYEAEADIDKVIITRVKSMIHNRLTELEDIVNSSYEAIDSVDSSDGKEKEAVEIFKQRLHMLRDLHKKAKSLFDLFNSSLFNNLINAKGGRARKKESPVS